MPKCSAGLLLYRRRDAAIEVFLVHPGGPFWAKKDVGAWSMPKGEVDESEKLLAAAQREFAEETGVRVDGAFVPLGEHRVTSGKILHAWALEADLDPAAVVSNTFKLEWPPKSGRWIDVPEIDRAGWFPLALAAEKIHRGQAEFLARLSRTFGAT